MHTNQFYALIQVADVENTAAFYQRHLGLRPMFESDWYVHLQSETDPSINLAVLRYDHETIPTAQQGPTKGVILTFEVADVDAEDARFKRADVPVIQPLRDEPHGQRHAIYQDPNGLLIDVVTPIAPTAEFAEGYDPAALPH
ncbi:MAG: VOC family protein [Pseudomonadota bacterium]